MDRRTFCTTASAALATLGVAGCAGLAGPGEPDGGENATDDSDGETADPFAIEGEVDDTTPNEIRVLSHEIFQTADGVGVIENGDQQPLRDIEVEVTLYDGDTVIGEFVDTSDEQLDFLAPGNRWRFRVSFADEGISSATNYSIEVTAEIADELDVDGGSGDANETEDD
jgi:hypothetical protein